MAAQSAGSNIALKANECLEHFFAGLRLLEVNKTTQLWSSLLDQLGRFQIWASNIGVFADVRSSLDYRLREVQDVRDLILQLLSSVDDCLKQLNGFWRVQYAKNQAQVQGDQNSSTATEENQNLEEFSETLDTIRESIDWLHRLSNSIRKASSLRQNARAEKFPLTDVDDPDGTDLTSQWMELYSRLIKREFPGLGDNVLKRLARSIVSRRKQIMYRLSRHERWAFQQEMQSRKASTKIQMPVKPTQEIPSGAQKPPGVKLGARVTAATGPNAPSQLTATTLPPEMLLRKKPASRISSVHTNPLNRSEEPLIPPPPEAATISKDFVCPYCCNICPRVEAIDPIKWAEHIQKDLEPYVCLFDPCEISDIQPTLFATSREWLEHMRVEHSMSWRCVARNHAPIAFPSQEEFKMHMRTEHAGKFEDDILEYVTASSARPLEDPFEGRCPFCDESPTDLNGHIGDHLKFLALYTLPRFDEEKYTTDTKGSSKRSNSFVKMSRTTMKQPTYPVTELSPDDIETIAAQAAETTLEGEPVPLMDFDGPAERLGQWNQIPWIPPQHEPLILSIVDEDECLTALMGLVRYQTGPMSFGDAAKHVLLIMRVRNAFRARKTQPGGNRALQTLGGHRGLVRSVAFSPGGELLASTSDDRTIKLWDACTGATLQTFEGHTGIVFSAVFSPDGKLLASAADDNTVRLWDPATGVALQTLEGHQGVVRSVAFSPDGKLLASASYDRTVKLWNPATRALMQTLEGHQGVVLSAAFSPDGKILASASDDCIVRLWDPATGAPLQTFEGHRDVILFVTFSPDGKLLASASYDYTVRLWDTATGATLRILQGHEGIVRSVAFSPDGKLLASASCDRTVRLWNPATGTALQTLKGHQGVIYSVVFSPDGKLLASASDDRKVKLWDLVTVAGVQSNSQLIEPSSSKHTRPMSTT